MNALAAAGAGFLLAVLWFDLMFDVQALRSLWAASICCAWCRSRLCSCSRSVRPEHHPPAWLSRPTQAVPCACVRSIAPVDLKVPDWLVEALRGKGPRVGEPDSLSAAEVVHPG